MEILKKQSIFIELILVFLIFFILYTLTLSHNLSAAHDSMSYVNDIDGGRYFHPHHLLYNLCAAQWVTLWKMTGIDVDSAYIVELLNAVFGALTISLFYFFLRSHVKADITTACAGAALPAFSYGVWYYSTAVEVYIIPLFFLILSFCVMAAGRVNARTYAVVGVTHGCAILFHQMNILFTPVVLSSLLLSQGSTIHSRVKGLVSYLVISSSIILIPHLYIILFVLKLRSFNNIMYWLTYYTHNPQYWSIFGPSTILKVAVGFGRSVIGGQFLFAFLDSGYLTDHFLKGKWLTDEVYLVRNLGTISAYILCGGTIVLALSLLAGILCQFRYWPKIIKSRKKDFLMLLIWFVSYTIFFLFWEPTNLEFWIPQSLICWLLFILMLREMPSEVRTRCLNTKVYLPCIAVLLFTINFSGSIQWLMNRENDYYDAKTREIVKFACPGDLIIIEQAWIMKNYLLRYTDSEVLALSSVCSEEGDFWKAKNRVINAIKSSLARGSKVILVSEEEIKHTSGIKPSLGLTVTDFINEILNTYKVKLVKKEEKIISIYILGSEL